MTQGEVEATHTTPSFDESVRLHSSPVFYVAEMNVVNDLQLTTILMLEIFNESCVRSQLKQKNAYHVRLLWLKSDPPFYVYQKRH